MATTKVQKSGGLTARVIGEAAAPGLMSRVEKAGKPKRGTSHGEQSPDEQNSIWQGVGAIVPPYEPAVLLQLFEHSSALRPCVDAYTTNIDAFGHRFEAVVDLDAADADERIRSYIYSRRAERDPATVADPGTQLATVTEEEVERARLELQEKMRAELVKLQHFFEYAFLDLSFVAGRRRLRQDLESLGNAYWEVLRDAAGAVCGFEHIPSFTVRHMPADKHLTEVMMRTKTNEFDYVETATRRRFRRFVQVFETQVTYFKEFGDPRVLSATSGAFYKDLDTLRAEEPERGIPATEVLHVAVHTSKSSYGIPRWVGTMLSVLGSRNAEEVNLDYFQNKSVPPMAILVQGGRITDDTVKRLEGFIDRRVKGKENFHRILVLEAENMGGTALDNGRMKIDLKPLTAAQHNDALFQNYDERNIDKVGQSFRLPRMLRGDIRDFNRATAEAALEFAESQVFRPERDDFDFMMNRKIFPALGVRYWKFKSNSAASQSPTDLAEIVSKLMTAGALTPAEGRDIASLIFNRPLQKIDAPWVKQPLVLSQQGIMPADSAGQTVQSSPQHAATGADPLGGAAMADANQQAATAPAGAPSAPKTGGIKLTGTDLASAFTINEVREDVGRGNLKLQDGTDDPDGFLTVAEFKAKRIAAGMVTGQDEGKEEAATGTAPKTKAADLAGSLEALLNLRKAIAAAESAEAKATHTAAQKRLAEVETETDEDLE